MGRIVLFLEDGNALREATALRLNIFGYDVRDFDRIDLATEFFEENADDIICVVTDLNMKNEWLGEHKDKSHGAALSGWVWLQEFVYRRKPKMPTVIYSKFIYCLEKTLREKKKLSELQGNKHIQCVSKGVGKDKGFDGLLKVLKELGIKPLDK
jgi:hypothetical protein